MRSVSAVLRTGTARSGRARHAQHHLQRTALQEPRRRRCRGPSNASRSATPISRTCWCWAAMRLYVLGKDLGATNVLLWDREDQLVSALNVTVTHDLDSLQTRDRSRAAVGEGRARKRAAEHRAVGPGLERAENGCGPAGCAKGYLGAGRPPPKKRSCSSRKPAAAAASEDKKAGQVINLMTVGGVQQVMLQVRVAEVSRDAARNLNAQLSALSNTGKWVAGGVNGGATFPDATLPAGRRAHSDLRRRHQCRRQSDRPGVRRIRADHAGHQQHRSVRQLPEQRFPGERRARCLSESRAWRRSSRSRR